MFATIGSDGRVNTVIVDHADHDGDDDQDGAEQPAVSGVSMHDLQACLHSYIGCALRLWAASHPGHLSDYRYSPLLRQAIMGSAVFSAPGRRRPLIVGK